MQDVFNEAIMARRIVLLSRLAVDSHNDDLEVVLSWLCEMATELEKRLDSVSLVSSREGI